MKKLVKTKMAEAVQRAKYVSIATDAWTDVNGQPVVNYIAMVGFLDASSRPDLLAGSCEHREVRPRQLHNGVGGAVHTRLVRRTNRNQCDKVLVELP